MLFVVYCFVLFKPVPTCTGITPHSYNTTKVYSATETRPRPTQNRDVFLIPRSGVADIVFTQEITMAHLQIQNLS